MDGNMFESNYLDNVDISDIVLSIRQRYAPVQFFHLYILGYIVVVYCISLRRGVSVNEYYYYYYDCRYW
jgi:hypothetical protein